MASSFIADSIRACGVAVVAMSVVLTDEDAAAAQFAYRFVLDRMGEPMALEMAAEALRARHRDLGKHAAEQAACTLIERMQEEQA